MFSIKPTVIALALGAATLLAVGATFGDTPATPAKSACEMCKPTTVTVPVKTDKGRTIGEKTVTKMNCPECMDPITSLLNTGKFEHTCTMPGMTKEACQSH